MYNKLFSKILDSSIWLENLSTRVVWITFLACMDQDGIVQLSSIGNVANRARVSFEEAEAAIKCLESPDRHSPDQELEGRRIQRIPGVGWLVLNAQKYRDIIKAEGARAANRERVRRHRAKLVKSASSNDVMPDVIPVMACNDFVMQSEANTYTDAYTKEKASNLDALQTVNKCQTSSMIVNHSQSQSAMSAHTEADTEADTDIYRESAREHDFSSPKAANFDYPLKELLEAFPDLELTPGQCGAIEAAVKPEDKAAWEATINKYRLNYNPMLKQYLPQKVGNLLAVFREEKDRLERQQNGTTSRGNKSERDKSAERTRNTRLIADELIRQGEMERAKQNLLREGNNDHSEVDLVGEPSGAD